MQSMKSYPNYMFSYGMNTNIGGMRLRCPDAVCLGKAVLYEHRFDFRYHADVAQQPGSLVHGLLWELDDVGLGYMDKVEGYPTYYTREEIWVDADDGNQYLAWVYKMQPGDGFEFPHDSYLQMVHEGYVSNDIPTDQIWTAMERCYEGYNNYGLSERLGYFG
jgi:gamma-glutamylcyclotransferase (GGCT)/AIG2-like uncharacterized protein YtfP